MQDKREVIDDDPHTALVVVKATVQAASQRELKFVDGMFLNKKDAAKARKEVRSHVARAHNQTENGSAHQKQKKRKRRPKDPVWEVHISATAERETVTPCVLQFFPSNPCAIPAVDSLVAQLPFVPFLVDHYHENLAVAVPELDGPDDTLLLRKSWFPMIIHSPVIFQVIVLFSASHFSMQHGDTSMVSDILFLKQQAITSLMEATKNPNGVWRDEVIAAAAKMGSYEAIYGTETAYHTHMSMVTDMVRRRGGMSSLGLNGFLARLLLFIDTNAAFLLNCKVHFDEASLPKLMNQFLPNPGQFIGTS